VIRDVHNMVQKVKDVTFNIFDGARSLDWQAVVAEFKQNNETVKNATRNLIDTSFRKLRSAEGAFELLQNFKSIESKGAIKEQMTNKLNDILDQFSREIDLVSEIFESQREKPPLTKNQPPVAGAIKWSRSIFARVKQTTGKLMTVEEEMMALELGHEVRWRGATRARLRVKQVGEPLALTPRCAGEPKVHVAGAPHHELREGAVQALDVHDRRAGHELPQAAHPGAPAGRRPNRRQLCGGPRQADARDALPGPHGVRDPGDRTERDAAGGVLPPVRVSAARARGGCAAACRSQCVASCGRSAASLRVSGALLRGCVRR